MNKQKLMKVTYYDEKNSIRLTGYADTVVWDEKGKATLAALRFGGYPEEVRGLADAIYGGITIEIESGDITSVAKDRKVPSGGKSRTREADDAAIFA